MRACCVGTSAHSTEPGDDHGWNVKSALGTSEDHIALAPHACDQTVTSVAARCLIMKRWLSGLLILLVAAVASWGVRPVENVVSRHFERQADMASLELAGHPEVFIEAEKRLARDNLGNVAPNPVSVWLFATHPPAVERIRMAEAWRAAHPQRHGSVTSP